MPTLAVAVTVLQLIFSPDPRVADLPLADIARVVHEIWSPHVEVVLSAPGTVARLGAHALSLHISDSTPTSRSGEPLDALAWIDFVDGEPQPAITIAPRRAAETIAKATVFGRPSREWPAVLERRMRANAIGRALAHEIGHYLLRSAAHAPRGLMRAAFKPQDFAEPDNNRFRLLPAQVDQVRARWVAPLRAEREATPGAPWPGAGDVLEAAASRERSAVIRPQRGAPRDESPLARP